jgi:hypothetical protein
MTPVTIVVLTRGSPHENRAHIVDPTDAFLFGQINDGNAIAIPYAKGFGWAAELNLDHHSKPPPA